MKVCSSCKQEKTLDEFGKRKTNKDGLDYLCKVCKRAEWQKNKDLEKHREQQRIYRLNNQEKIKEYNKQYSKKYKKTENGKLARKMYKHNRRSRDKDLIYTLSKEYWEESLNFFNNSCAYCGKKSNRLQHEHVVPSSKGGHYTKQNIVPACKECNLSKLDNDLFEWYVNYSKYDKKKLEKILKWTNIKFESQTQQLALL